MLIKHSRVIFFLADPGTNVNPYAVRVTEDLSELRYDPIIVSIG